MEHGKAIPYANSVEAAAENSDAPSYLVSRRGRGQTYESYLSDHPGATSGEKEYARQRIEKRVDGEVPFRPSSTQPEFKQGDLFEPEPELSNEEGVKAQSKMKSATEKALKNREWLTPNITSFRGGTPMNYQL
jgi:hypothetical protein